MPIVLYKKQREIVDFICQFIQKKGMAPTFREIADAINVSSLATVFEHLGTLEKKGVIKRDRGTMRAIEIVDKNLFRPSVGVELPILGFIAAGSPIEPFTDPNARMNISPAILSGKKRAYVLQVKGESLIDEGILDGDFVVIEETGEVKEGDIVVALLKNGLATLKRFFKEKTRIRLEPANSSMSPIFATHVRIQGRVVGIVRRFENFKSS